MATNTELNIGVRRFIPALNAYRNFQPGGSSVYLCNKERMTIGSTVYHVGDALPLGALPDAQLEVLFNAGDINPQS